MLMLSRSLNETVMIGDDVQVKVLGMDIINMKVLLGFKAPKCVSVHREEIYKRIQKQGNSNDSFYQTGGN